jgi:hypothetical protein
MDPSVTVSSAPMVWNLYDLVAGPRMTRLKPIKMTISDVKDSPPSMYFEARSTIGLNATPPEMLVIEHHNGLLSFRLHHIPRLFS